MTDDAPAAESLRDRWTYWRYRAAWAVGAAIPQRLAWRLARTAGRLAYRFASDAQREQVRRNLARVAGHPPPDVLEALVVEAYGEYARYWADSFRLHRMRCADVLARSTGEGLEHLDALARGGGGIMATAHLGSWDVGAFFCHCNGWPLTVVAEVVRPRRLFDRFVELRRAAGMEVVPLVRGADLVGVLEQHVRRGRIATLLADRDLTGRGPVVEFFGEPCRLPAGPAVLAQRTGRPVVAAAFLATPTGWHGVVRPPVDVSGTTVEEGTQLIARELEAIIGRYPAQWHVFVRNWLAEREPDHPALRRAAG